MSLHRRLASVMLVAIVTVGLVGAGTALGQGAGQAPNAPEKTVKIGVLAPLNAGLVEFGAGIRNSVQVAVDQANQRHTIAGWKIELAAVDDSSDTKIGAANVSMLVNDPAVIGVVGPYNSGVAGAALPVLAPAGLALVSPSNTLASLTLGDDLANPKRQFDNYFRLVASDKEQAPFLARSARKLGARKVAVVSETKAVSKGLADAFADAFSKGGGTVTVRQVVPDGATDFGDFLKAALPGHPDMIFFGGEYPVGATLRHQATAAGYTKPLMGGDGIKDAAYITDAGAASKGTFASTVGVPADRLSTAKPFLRAYDKDHFAKPATDYGPYAYDAANLVIAAAKQALAGHDTIPADARAGVVAFLAHADRKGITGRLSFDRFGDTKHVVFTLYRVQGAKGHLAWVPFKP